VQEAQTPQLEHGVSALSTATNAPEEIVESIEQYPWEIIAFAESYACRTLEA